VNVVLDTDLPEGRPVGRAISDGQRELPVILLRDRTGVRAWLNSCPHAGVRLDWRPDDFLDHTGTWLLCSMHGALFELAGGRCVAGPCRGSRLVEIGRCAADAAQLEIRDVERLPSRAYAIR
jgi:nitrite reductase/ring-hydroxylating ferredoxin subunit